MQASKWVSNMRADSHAPSSTDSPPARPAPATPDAALWAAHLRWVWSGDVDTHPLDIWQTTAVAPQTSDTTCLVALATKHDAFTGGHGWYWIGHAILSAAMSRREIRSPKFIAVILDTWRAEDSYGADSEAYREKAERPRLAPRPRPATPSAGVGASYTAEQGNVPPAPTAGLRTALSAPDAPAHPAIDAYTTAFGLNPNAEQVERIVATVTDLPAWTRTISEWLANGWRPSAVAKLLDRYSKEAVGRDPETPPDIRWVYLHPDLDSDSRSAWITRFRAAATPADKRAVLGLLLTEHPTTEEEWL